MVLPLLNFPYHASAILIATLSILSKRGRFVHHYTKLPLLYFISFLYTKVEEW